MSETPAPRDYWTGPLPENATVEQWRRLEGELDARAYSAKVALEWHRLVLEHIQAKLIEAGEVPISQLKFRDATVDGTA